MKISFVCPVFNEKEHIAEIFSFFESQNPDISELILVDGGSTDGTVDIIKAKSSQNTSVHLLSNPKQFQNYALNIGINAARGDWIIRLDAHTSYASDYADQILHTFSEKNADIVGGPMRPVGKTDFEKAVGYATSVKFGIGDSSFHDTEQSGEAESVYLGAFKKTLPGEIGFYDEELICNEDDEFAYRAKAHGKLIYLNADIRSYYRPRSNLKTLFKQYYRYGLYKPLVFIKTAAGMRIRHWIPALFTVYFFSLALSLNAFIYLLPFLLYLFLDVYYSFSSPGSLSVKIKSLIIFPCLHLAYGIGFLFGCIKWFFKGLMS